MALAPLDKCTVTGPVLKPDGTPCYPGSVVFALSKRDRDGDIIVVPAPITADVDADGNISVDLWPNSDGYAGTVYSATIMLGKKGTARTQYSSFQVVVPDADTAKLAEIMELSPPDSVDDIEAAIREAQGYATSTHNDAVQTAADRAVVEPIAEDAAAIAPHIGAVVAVNGIASEVEALAAITAKIVTLAGISDDVSAVALIATAVSAVAAAGANITALTADLANVDSVADALTAINAVALKLDDVSAVAAVHAAVSAVAGALDAIGAVADNLIPIGKTADIHDEIQAVAAIVDKIVTVAGIQDDVSLVAAISAKVTAVANSIDDVNALAAALADVHAVAGIVDELNTVARISADVTTVADAISSVQGVAALSGAVTTDTIGWTDVSASGSVTDGAQIFYWPDTLRETDGFLTKLEIGVNAGKTLTVSVDRLNEDGTLTHVADYAVAVPAGAAVVDDLDIPVPAGCVVGVGGVAGIYYETTGGNPAYWFTAAVPTVATPKTISMGNKIHSRFTLKGDVRSKAEIAYASSQAAVATIGENVDAGWLDIVSTGTATPAQFTVILRDSPAPQDGYIADVTIGASVAGAVKVMAVSVVNGVAAEIGASKTVAVAAGVQTLEVGIQIAEGQYVAFTPQQNGAFQFQANSNPTGVRFWYKTGSPLAEGDALTATTLHRFEIAATIKTGLLGSLAGGVPAVQASGNGDDESAAFSKAAAPANTGFVPAGQYVVTGLAASGHGLWGPGKPYLNGIRFPLPLKPQSYTLLEQVRENLIEHAAAGDVLALIGDSISHFYAASMGSRHWFNMFTAWLNYGIAADEPIMTALRPSSTYVPTFYGVTVSGSVSTGTKGPLQESLILADGASLSFAGAYEQVDAWYTQQSGAGDLIFSFGGTDYKTISCDGATQTDMFSAAGATGQSASGTYAIRASRGPVEITGLLRLAPLSGNRKRFRTGRFAHGSYTFANFGSAAVASILTQCTYAGGVCVPILALGINDSFGTNPTSIVSIAEAVIDGLVAGGVPRIFALPPMRPSSAWNSSYTGGRTFDPAQGALRRLYREKGVIVLPVDGIDMTGLGNQADGLHPNDAGNDAMLVAVVERLARL
ncbi:MAG: hypothetical protein BGN87_00080 [Rhizobiales bacterium 65-79]|nr:hypothetical protein [Hyphomicrobiales bacterium]OJU02583.1 MAG: hypothetical protein BGN87_00080 [Rhizobiales bacterium 65-79]